MQIDIHIFKSLGDAWNLKLNHNSVTVHCRKVAAIFMFSIK